MCCILVDGDGDDDNAAAADDDDCDGDADPARVASHGREGHDDDFSEDENEDVE